MARLACRWVFVVLACVACAGSARADELAEEQERTIESLHAFGVRGLPTAFDQCAGAEVRHEAIDAGLAWLAAHQRPDGSWWPKELHWCNGQERKDGAPTGEGKNLYAAGVTGMTVTAFLGAGYTHRGQHPFAQSVRRALTWLVQVQDREGCIGPRSSQQYVYNHAFGTLALVEAFALTGDPRIRVAAQKAVDFSAMARNPGMAWRYGVQPGDNDTSITGCMGLPLYVALRLARAGERADVFEPLGIDDSVFDGMRAWIDLMVDEETGRAGYVMRGTGPARPAELLDEYPGEKSEACTAITVFLRKVLPDPDDSAKERKRTQQLVDKGVQLMLELKPAWTTAGGNIDFYYWYYASMAMRQVGGDAWSAWDAALASTLLGNQRKDGDACGPRGSWDPVGVWAKSDGGRIYATAICLLMLETPDRMRPLPEDRSDLLDALAVKELDPLRRASVLRALGLMMVPKAGPAVATWVASDDERVCAAAAEALGRLDAGAKGVKELSHLLDDKRLVVRRAAVRALAEQGVHLKTILDPLVARLDDPDAQVAAGAARAIGRSGVTSAADALRPRLVGGDIAVRVAAAAGLFALSEDRTAAVPVLLEGLKAAEPAVRVEAAAAFHALGSGYEAAGEALEAALKDDTPRVRIHAAEALLQLGRAREAAEDALVGALDAPDGRDRLLALEAFTTRPSPKATPKLDAQLLTGSVVLRVQAAAALEAAGPGGRPAAATLSWCSASGPSALRKAASNAFDALKLGPAEAVTFLVPAFDRTPPDQRVRAGAARALAFQGEAVVPALVERLPAGSPAMRAGMLEVFRRMGRAAAGAVPAIARAMTGAQEADPLWRAALALAAIGPDAAPALPQLTEALEHKAGYVRTAALDAIAAIAPGSKEAVQRLVVVASNKDEKQRDLRLAALRALGGLQGQVDAVMPALLHALQDEGEQVRQAGVGGLVALWPACEPYLEKALEEADTRVRNGVAQAVARIGADAKKLVKPLAKILEGGGIPKDSVYAGALAAIGKPAVSPLMKLLRSPLPIVRGEAARALGVIGPDAKRALNALKRLLSDPDFDVQIRARMAIDKIKE